MLSPLNGCKVSQFVADLTTGDAISMDCLEKDHMLSSWGCRARIYADRVHPRVDGKALKLEQHHLEKDEIVILHYSLWSRSAEYVLKLRPARLVMVYHNITPAQYFTGLNTEAERVTREGRSALVRFAPFTALGLGDSDFNRQELEKAGFSRTSVLPIAVNFEDLDGEPNRRLLEELRDGYVNLLSVGRIVPNKKQEDVIKLFYHYKRHINPRSRLYLVGPTDMGVPYKRWLESVVEYLGLDPHVFFPGRVSHADLLAYYRASRAFLCMSEHEGFCVPLVESMYLDTPVLAYASSAIPETLGDGGVLSYHKNYAAMAEMLQLIVEDGPVRTRIIANGRRRAATFSRAEVAAAMRNCLESLL